MRCHEFHILKWIFLTFSKSSSSQIFFTSLSQSFGFFGATPLFDLSSDATGFSGNDAAAAAVFTVENGVGASAFSDVFSNVAQRWPINLMSVNSILTEEILCDDDAVLISYSKLNLMSGKSSTRTVTSCELMSILQWRFSAFFIKSSTTTFSSVWYHSWRTFCGAVAMIRFHFLFSFLITLPFVSYLLFLLRWTAFKWKWETRMMSKNVLAFVVGLLFVVKYVLENYEQKFLSVWQLSVVLPAVTVTTLSIDVNVRICVSTQHIWTNYNYWWAMNKRMVESSWCFYVFIRVDKM